MVEVVIGVACWVILVSLYIFSSLTKIINTKVFAEKLRIASLPLSLRYILPFFELLIVFFLLSSSFVMIGTLLSCALLMIYAIYLMRSGSSNSCNCFILNSREEAYSSKHALARNIVLIFVSLFFLYYQLNYVTIISPEMSEYLNERSWVFDLALFLLLLASVFIVLDRIESFVNSGAPIDAPKHVPIVATKTFIGKKVNLAGLSVTNVDGKDIGAESLFAIGKYKVLIFTAMGCSACKEIYPLIVRWKAKLDDMDVNVYCLVVGSGESNGFMQNLRDAYNIDFAFFQTDMNISKELNVVSYPSAIYLDPDNTISSDIPIGRYSIELLVENIFADKESPWMSPPLSPN